MSSPLWFSSLLFVVFENHGIEQVRTLPSHQYLAQHGAVHEQWYDIGHPSGPNYRALAAGNWWSSDEFIDQQHDTIGTVLANVYEKPVVVSYAGDTAQRHDPFLDLQTPTVRLSSDDFSKWLGIAAADAGCKLIQIGLDDQNNAHNGPLEVADLNLTRLISQLDGSTWFNTPVDGKYPVLFVVWDESFVQGSDTDRVFAAWYGKGVKPGSYDTRHDHRSYCRTVTDNWGAAPLNQAIGAIPVQEVWA